MYHGDRQNIQEQEERSRRRQENMTWVAYALAFLLVLWILGISPGGGEY